MHAGRDVKAGTLAAILKVAGITPEELRSLL
jgi:predicted RNA binding protein YcfA (HicA-like mRNA interferase family)